MYEVKIECADENIARCIQQWVKSNFHDDEVYWTSVEEK